MMMRPGVWFVSRSHRPRALGCCAIPCDTDVYVNAEKAIDGPREASGENVIAYVTTAGRGRTVAAQRMIGHHCRVELATYKVLGEVRVVDGLGRNAVGRVLKRALAEAGRGVR